MRARARPSRWALAGLILLFVVPGLLAWLMSRGGWRPTRTVNYGTLLSPIRPVSLAGLETRDGQRLQPGFFARKWTVVLLGPAPCVEPCRDALYKIRQSRLALGKDMNRVQRLYVTPGDRASEAEDLTPLREAHAGLRLARASPAWLATFDVRGEPPAKSYRIYLIDPQSYLIMYYDLDVDATQLLKDLKRLLRVSAVG